MLAKNVNQFMLMWAKESVWNVALKSPTMHAQTVVVPKNNLLAYLKTEKSYCFSWF